MDIRDRWIHFKIRDVYHPHPDQVLMDLHGDDLLQGKVIDLSDSGMQEGTFVVVEVEGMQQPLVVPMARILGIL